MSENPNPRTWRSGMMIVDLETIDMICRAKSHPNSTLITRRGAARDDKIGMSDEEHELLLQAFEIYRSNR